MLVMELWKSLWKIRMGFVRSSMKNLKIETIPLFTDWVTQSVKRKDQVMQIVF